MVGKFVGDGDVGSAVGACVGDDVVFAGADVDNAVGACVGVDVVFVGADVGSVCLLYTSPSPRD